MYKKILVPMALDHDISPETLEIAKSLLAKGGTITALHVHEALHGTVSAYVDEETIRAGQENSRRLLEEKTANIEGITAVMIQGHTARTIVDYAHENGIDCVVIGSHKPGFRDFLLGSTAARVVRHCRCSVHVQRTQD